jgi:hypothetical protein
LVTIACCCQLAQAGDGISVRDDGSITGSIRCGASEEQPIVLSLGLPQIPAAKLWREGDALRGLWVTNGVLYKQTTLLIDASVGSNSILLVNVEGDNTNSQYAEALAELVFELNGQRQELELKDGFVWRRTGDDRSLLGSLEISESGVRVPQGQRLQFSGNMPPSQKGSMTLKIPLLGIDGEAAAERLKDIEFEAELSQRLKFRTEPEAQAGRRVVFAHEQPAREGHRVGSEETSSSIPQWFPKAPRLPPAHGQVVRVRTADQLLEAVDALEPGGTILVEDGYYRLPRTLVLDHKKNVAIRGASGDPAKVTLSGKGWDSGSPQNDDILHIARCEGVTIADLTFADCRSYGVKVEAENGPKDIRIYNCRFRDIGVRALKGSAGTDPNVRAVNGSVRFCSFENTRVPPADWLFGGDYISAIDMMALEDWTFSDNVFQNIRGRNGGGRAAIFIWVRSRKVTVERNLIVNCDRGVAFGNPGESTANRPGERLVYVSDGIIQNNMIIGGPDCGIELWHVDQIEVLHNSIWRPDENRNRGIRIGKGTIRTEILNNLIHGEITMDGGEAQLGNNLTGILEGYFVQPGSGNLALTAQAVGAIDKAEPLPEVPTDIRGRRRVGNADFGAWEFDGAR